MTSPTSASRIRHASAALALSAIVLLGCARKVLIEVPQGFHGTVHIECTGLTDDRSTNIKVSESGVTSVKTCPVRQTDTVVTRAGMAEPVNTNVMWTTTGDGLVREITFDVR